VPTVTPAPSITPPAPTTDEKGCPVRRLEVGKWMCDIPSDELDALLNKLSEESNPSCPEMASQKRAEFEQLCPKAETQATITPQEEVTPTPIQEPAGAPTQAPQPSQAQPAAMPTQGPQPQPAAMPTQGPQPHQAPVLGLPAQHEAGVSTSMETVPKDGYNEIHIVVKVPSKYQQVATGSAGTTFATAIQSLTQRKKGGTRSHRVPITPKRKNRNINKLLNRKSLKRR